MSETVYHTVAARGRKEKKKIGNIILYIFCATVLVIQVYFQLTVQLVLMFLDVMAVVYS
jgi:hypothetical protein